MEDDLDEDFPDLRSRAPNNTFNRLPSGNNIRERKTRRVTHPLRLHIRKLESDVDVEHLKNFLAESACPEPNSVSVKKQSLEQEDGSQITVFFGFIEFAYTHETLEALDLIREGIRRHSKDWLVSFAYKNNYGIRECIVEKDFQVFRQKYQQVNIVPQTASMTNGRDYYTGHATDFETMTGQLVKFLPNIDSDCDTCIDLPNLNHLHYIISESIVVDPQNDIPDILEVSCQGCGKDSNLKKCSKCELVYYCSRSCQLKDWTKHRHICSSTGPNMSFVASMNGSLNTSANVVSSPRTSLAAATIVSETATQSAATSSPNGGLELIQGPLVVRKDMIEKLEQAKESLAKLEVTQNRLVERKVNVTPTRKIEELVKTSTPKVEPYPPAVQVMKAVPAEPKRQIKVGDKIAHSIVWQSEENTDIYFMSDDIILEKMAPQLSKIKKEEKLLPILPASVGLYCAAKSVDDGNFYRAQVKEILGNEVKVYFIDYGNSNVIDCKDLRDLPNALDPSKGGFVPLAIKIRGKDPAVQFKVSSAYNNSFIETFTVFSEVAGVYIVV